MNELTPGDLFDLKRNNFVVLAKKHFQFLVNEFGYGEPVYSYSVQKNGSILKDQYVYENAKNGISISVSNSYHPVDYGFEVRLFFEEPNKYELIHYVLKEKQDVDQSYLVGAAGIVRRHLMFYRDRF